MRTPTTRQRVRCGSRCVIRTLRLSRSVSSSIAGIRGPRAIDTCVAVGENGCLFRRLREHHRSKRSAGEFAGIGRVIVRQSVAGAKRTCAQVSAGESPSWLRHRILIPAFEGSNPSSPAISAALRTACRSARRGRELPFPRSARALPARVIDGLRLSSESADRWPSSACASSPATRTPSSPKPSAGI